MKKKKLRSHVRTAPGPVLERRLDLSNVDVDALQKALTRALERIPSDPPMPRVRVYTITVTEQIKNVRSIIRNTAINAKQKTKHVSFTELLSANQTRVEVIVTFLAVLKLIKQRELIAVQDDTFGSIVLVPAESD